MKPKSKTSIMRGLIGKRVKYEYVGPSISCCLSGLTCRGEGKVIRLTIRRPFGLCMLVDNGVNETYVTLEDINMYRETDKAMKARS